MRKPGFCICENKDADQLRGNHEADQRLGCVTCKVQFLFYLNPKFQVFSHLLWLYSPVCVRPGRKPRRPILSQRGSCVSGVYDFFLLFFHLVVYDVSFGFCFGRIIGYNIA